LSNGFLGFAGLFITPRPVERVLILPLGVDRRGGADGLLAMEPGCLKEGEAATQCDEEKRWAVELHCLEQLLDALFYGSGTSSGKTARAVGLVL
jgi:hypothetical protein